MVRKMCRQLIATSLLASGLTVLTPDFAGAQSSSPGRQPEVRTWEQMESDPTPTVPRMVPLALPVPAPDSQAKGENKAAASAAQFSHEHVASGPANNNLSGSLVVLQNFPGVDQAVGGTFPPDTHGATTDDQGLFVEVVNLVIAVFDEATGNRLGVVPLSTFFNTPGQFIFDPRVVFDHDQQRWVVVATRDPRPNGTPSFLLAVSVTTDPMGAYFIYNNIPVPFPAGNFVDFPGLGLDERAVIVTGNLLGVSGAHSLIVPISKAAVYNGALPATIPVFDPGGIGTITPPIVLDHNPQSFLLGIFTGGSNRIRKFTLANSGDPNLVTLTASDIPVPFYTDPLPARQAGTTIRIETGLDPRFSNAGTQLGDSLWAVDEVRFDDGSTARFYEFDTFLNSAKQVGDLFTSLTSNDWNASIAANLSNDAFVTWTSNDPVQGVNPQMVISAQCHLSVANLFLPAMVVATSPTFQSDMEFPTGRFRWGDYSAVSIADIDDPPDATTWFVNEVLETSATWTSNITQARLEHCDEGSNKTAHK